MGSCASLLSRNETAASAIVTTGPSEGDDASKELMLVQTKPSSDVLGQAMSEAAEDRHHPEPANEDGMLRKGLGGDDSSGAPSTSGRPGHEGPGHPTPTQSTLPPITKPSQLSSLPPIMPQEPPGRMLDDVPLPYGSGFSVGDGDSRDGGASFVPPHRHYHHHLMKDPHAQPPPPPAQQHEMPPPLHNRLPDIVRCTSPPTQRWGAPMQQRQQQQQQQQQHTDAHNINVAPEDRWDMQPDRLTRPDDAQQDLGTPGETSAWDHNSMMSPPHPNHYNHHEQQQQQQQQHYEQHYEQQQAYEYNHHEQQHHGDYYDDEAAGYPHHEGGGDELDDSYGGPTSMGVLKDIIGLAHGEQQQGGFQQGGGHFPSPGAAGGEEEHQPDADEIVQYARHLGMDLAKDADLLWIAEQALKAPMPAHWSCHYDEGSGNDYYYNEISGVTAWEHPLHEHFRALFLQMKEEKERSAIRNKLAGRRNKQQAQSEVKRGEHRQSGGGGGRRRREQPRESFISDLDDSQRFDDSNFTGTEVDSSLGNSLDMSRDMSRSRLSDTYNSLDMSLSNSEIGGLKLNLMGMINRAPKKTRGGGLGLELKQHSKEDGSRDRNGRQRDSSTKRSGKAAFARMLDR